VIIGRERSRFLFAALLYGTYLLIVGFAAFGWTPLPTMVAGLLAPFAAAPVSIVRKKTDGPNLIRALKLTARLHLWTGLALAVGSAIAI
jgi:1,4-dihydroxy-2-naphthoate octaprenyltransferase